MGYIYLEGSVSYDVSCSIYFHWYFYIMIV